MKMRKSERNASRGGCVGSISGEDGADGVACVDAVKRQMREAGSV
jgi:hypothetical protein